MESPDTWRWIWLVATALFAAGEIITTGFFLLPFAVGALVATLLAFAGVSVAIQWITFVAVSATCSRGSGHSPVASTRPTRPRASGPAA